MQAKRIVVRGLVQGVGFRWFVRQKARALKLEGWVRNQPDGSVEVWAEGMAEALSQLQSLLETGPDSANVHSLDVTDVNPASEGIRFDIV